MPVNYFHRKTTRCNKPALVRLKASFSFNRRVCRHISASRIQLIKCPQSRERENEDGYEGRWVCLGGQRPLLDLFFTPSALHLWFLSKYSLFVKKKKKKRSQNSWEYFQILTVKAVLWRRAIGEQVCSQAWRPQAGRDLRQMRDSTFHLKHARKSHWQQISIRLPVVWYATRVSDWGKMWSTGQTVRTFQGAGHRRSEVD